MQDGNSGESTSISPSTLWPGVCKLHNKYRSLNQQDAPELFRYFIDGLIDGELKVLKQKGLISEEKSCYKKIESPTESIFGHYQAHRVTCLHCNYISWTFHLSSDINIDIDKEIVRKSRFNLADEKKQATVKVQEEIKMLKTVTKDNHFELRDGDLINLKADPVPYYNGANEKLYAPYSEKTSFDQDLSLTLENLLYNYFERERFSIISRTITHATNAMRKEATLRKMKSGSLLRHSSSIILAPC